MAYILSPLSVAQDILSGGMIIVGVVILGITCYVLYNEMVSSKGPYVIYKKAAARCLENSKVVDLLGEPIKVHGTGYRRKQHIRYVYIHIYFFLMKKKITCTCVCICVNQTVMYMENESII